MRPAVYFSSLILLISVLTACDSPRHTPLPRLNERQQVLAEAAGWLWSQQAADGGWHSSTYRLLESGQALTPFILHALLPGKESAGDTNAILED